MANISISNLQPDNISNSLLVIQELSEFETKQIKGGETLTDTNIQRFDDGSILVTHTVTYDGWRGSTYTWSYDIDGNRGTTYVQNFFIA